MKVLIAGATGALGRPLVRALLDRGHTVDGITRTPGNAGALSAAGAAPIVADCMDRDALLVAVRGLQVDAVVHALTALKKPPLRYAVIEQTNRLRIQGTSNLLDAARATGARRFVAESMIVGYGLGDWGDTVLTEDTPFAPPGRTTGLDRVQSAFRSIEGQVREAAAAGWIQGVSLRYGAFYGPDSVAGMVEMLRRHRLPLVSGGGGVMHWINIDDAASATVAALEATTPAAAYNITDEEPVSWRDFVGRMAEVFGAPAPRSLPRWMVRLAAPYGVEFTTTRMRASNARAKAELGWTPAVPTYREGLARLAQGARPQAGSAVQAAG